MKALFVVAFLFFLGIWVTTAQQCNAGAAKGNGAPSCSAGSSTPPASSSSSSSSSTNSPNPYIVFKSDGSLDLTKLPLRPQEKEQVLKAVSETDWDLLDGDLQQVRSYVEQRKKQEQARKDQEEMRKPLYPPENATQDNIVILNEQNFDAFINTPGKHKLIKLYADWCGYCRQFSAPFHTISKSHKEYNENNKIPSDVLFGVVNIDYAQGIARRMDREGVPAVYLYTNTTKSTDTPLFYDGFRTSFELAHWLNERTGSNVMVPGLKELLDSKKKEAKVLKLFTRPGTDVKIVHAGEWERLLGQKHVMAYFYFDSCKPCFKFAPFYEEMAYSFRDVQRVTLAAINTDKDYDLAVKYNIQNVPAIMWFKRGSTLGDKGHKIEGTINPETLTQFINQQINSRILLNGMTEALPSDIAMSNHELPEYEDDTGGEEIPQYKQYYGIRGETPVVELTKHNFNEIVMDPRKAVVVEFYAEWCSYCRTMRKTFLQVAEAFKSTKSVVIAAINADHFQSVLHSQDIQGFPTIKIYRATQAKKSNPDSYHGDHSFGDLVNWINQRTGASASSFNPPNVERFLNPQNVPAPVPAPAAAAAAPTPTPDVTERMQRLESKLDKLIDKALPDTPPPAEAGNNSN